MRKQSEVAAASTVQYLQGRAKSMDYDKYDEILRADWCTELLTTPWTVVCGSVL